MNILIKIIFVLIGAIIGIIIVRTFALNGIEQLYFDAVLDTVIEKGRLSDNGKDILLNSNTFAKSVTGAIISSLVSAVVIYKTLKRIGKKD